MKNLLKNLTAFSLGNTMLLLSYILVYAIDGSYRFTLEISKLTEFEYLLGQVAFSGIIYVVIFSAIYVGSVFIGISVIGCAVAAIAYIIYNSVEKYKINKALKEKQRDKK